MISDPIKTSHNAVLIEKSFEKIVFIILPFMKNANSVILNAHFINMPNKVEILLVFKITTFILNSQQFIIPQSLNIHLYNTYRKSIRFNYIRDFDNALRVECNSVLL